MLKISNIAQNLATHLFVQRKYSQPLLFDQVVFRWQQPNLFSDKFNNKEARLKPPNMLEERNFETDLFAQYPNQQQIAWPRLDSVKLDL